MRYDTMETQRLIVPDSLAIGHVYRFHPCNNLPKLLLYRSPIAECKNAFVIRRQSLLIVLGVEKNYHRISCAGCIGWLNLGRDLLNDVKVFQPVERYRAYEDWRGNNYFLLQGKLMLGSHGIFFLVSLLNITVFSIIFFYYIMNKVANAQLLLVSRYLSRCSSF
jgi:hypothetical protein